MSTSPPPTATRPRRSEELTLEVEDLVYGGRGIARHDGFVVFVRGALPGDLVRARVTRSKRHYAEAEAIEIVRPSTDRIPPSCDHGGEPCPGAPWQELPYELQLEHKQRQIADSLERIGGLSDYELEPIEPAVERWRYRNKFEYSFGERDGELVLGFHARGRWDVVVDAEDCLLASEANNAERNRIRHWASVEGIPAYDRRAQDGVLRNLVVREGRRTGELQTRLVTSPASFSRPPVDLHTVIEGPAGSTDGPTGALGAERLTEELAGLRFEISPPAFFQTNTEMAERLYAIAGDYAGLGGRERVFDLFCGIGTIGLVLARDAGEVWGVEVVPEAIDDADSERRHQRHRERPLPRCGRPPRDPPADRGGRPARPRGRRSASLRAVEQGRPPCDRVRSAADRLRLVQPDDAGAERRGARRGRI